MQYFAQVFFLRSHKGRTHVHPSVSFQRFSDKRNDLKSTNKLNIDTSKFDDDVSQLSQ